MDPSLYVSYSAGGSGYSPEDILKKYGQVMSDSERQMLKTRSRVYYYHMRKNPGGPYNDGWDDADGHYLVEKCEHLVFRYQVLEVVGVGSFGQVLRCIDYKTRRSVAIKMTRHNYVVKVGEFENELNTNNALALMPPNRNIVEFIGSFDFYGHGCLVFDFVPGSLEQEIDMVLPNGLPMEQVQKYTHSILQGLLHLKSGGIVHGEPRLPYEPLRRPHLTLEPLKEPHVPLKPLIRQAIFIFKPLIRQPQFIFKPPIRQSQLICGF